MLVVGLLNVSVAMSYLEVLEKIQKAAIVPIPNANAQTPISLSGSAKCM
jgi:hypothetical protein